MLLYIIFVLLNILYIIFGYMITLMSAMIYDSPNNKGFYTDLFFYSMVSTLFFALGSMGSFLYTGGYVISLFLLLTNLSLIGMSSFMISYFQDGSFAPKNKNKHKNKHKLKK